jgi:hypothetical protein
MVPNEDDAVIVDAPAQPPVKATVDQARENAAGPLAEPPVVPVEPFDQNADSFSLDLKLSKSKGTKVAVTDSTAKSGIKADLDEYAKLTTLIDRGKKQLAEWEMKRDEIAAKLEEKAGVVAEARRLPPAVQQSVDLMAKLGGTVSAKQVATSLKVTVAAVYLRFNRLVALGLAERPGHGQYVLTQKGKDHAK